MVDTVLVRVAVLESEARRTNELLTKIQDSGEQLRRDRAEDMERINRRIDISREEFKRDIKKNGEDTTKMVDDKLNAQTLLLQQQLSKITEKLDGMDRWRWIIIGGAGVIASISGFILSKITTFAWLVALFK